MKKLFYLAALTTLSLIVSCQNEDFNENIEETIQKNASDSECIKFSSSSDFLNAISIMKESDASNLPKSALTRAGVNMEIPTGFVSLRDYLESEVLKNLSDTELAEITSESLSYDVEDALILDPYFTSILNKDREIQLSDSIYRYVENGLIVYQRDEENSFNADNAIIPEDVSLLTHGQSITIYDTNGSQADFIRIEYAKEQLHSFEDANGTTRAGEKIYLDDGTFFYKDDYQRIAKYEHKGGTGSWFANTLSDVFGTNVTLVNEYDSKHRMKLRMYSQDYIIYRAEGMTVRMQQKSLGIWWRKKAQKFIYGWSAIECKYDFPTPQFQTPPSMPNGYVYDRYPIGINMNFPFSKTDGVIFHIPFVNYDVKTGDINAVLSKSLKLAANNVKKWFEDSNNASSANGPRGIYTTDNNDKSIIIVYPAQEEYAEDDGREAVEWDKQWFSGNFVVGFGSNVTSQPIHYQSLSLSPAKDATIIRGTVYASVLYNNEWRLCVITTM